MARPDYIQQENIPELNAVLFKACNLEATLAKVEERFDGTIVVELSPTISADQKECVFQLLSHLKEPIQYR